MASWSFPARFVFGSRRKHRVDSRAARRSRFEKRWLRFESLEARQLLTSVSLVDPIPDIPATVEVPVGKTTLVPLSGMTDDGTAITYSFQSTDPNVTVSQVSPAGKNLVLNISATGSDSFTGTIVIHLFDDLAPETTAHIESLVNSGFYTGLDFFRVIDGFAAQTGSSTNNGQGGSNLGSISDEFTDKLTFTSPGLIAMANSGDDTGDSQFFISPIAPKGSTSPITLDDMPEFLNFNYPIFGQIVSGFDTFEKIMQVPVTTSPSNPQEQSLPNGTTITITSASITDDTPVANQPQFAVAMISAPAGVTNATVTVTATANGATDSQTFMVTSETDPNTTTTPDRPFLGTDTDQGDQVVANQSGPAGDAIHFNLTVTQIGTAPLTVDILEQNTASPGTFQAPADFTVTFGTQQRSGNVVTVPVTLTPKGNVATSLLLEARVRDNVDRSGPLGAGISDPSNYDTQKFTLNVTANSKPTIDTVGTQTTTAPNAVTFSLTGHDTESDPLTFVIKNSDGSALNSSQVTAAINGSSVTLTPAAGFSGTLHLEAGVRDSVDHTAAQTGVDTASNFTFTTFDLVVNPGTAPATPADPTSPGLGSSDQSGTSGGNPITSSSDPSVTVSGVAGTTLQYFVNSGGTDKMVTTATVTTTGPVTTVLPAGSLALGSNTVTVKASNGTTTSTGTTLTLIYAPSFDQVFTVPGPIGQSEQLQFNWISRQAEYNNELGVYTVADVDGTLTAADGSLAPSAAGYAKAALSSSTSSVLFASGDGAGATITLNVTGGQLLAFYLVQDNTTANFLSLNPSNAGSSNDRSSAPLAFFSVNLANPDGFRHVQAVSTQTGGPVQYNFEDQWSGGDQDFNDLSMNVGLVGGAAASPGVLLALGSGTTATINATLATGTNDSSTPGDVGFFFVDGPNGNIGTVNPGDSGYLAAAFASGNFNVLFGPGQAAGAQTSANLTAGKYIAFFTISSGTVAQLLASNPSNSTSGSPLAFFSVTAANSDQTEHFRWFGNEGVAVDPSKFHLHINDQVIGGNSSFNDLGLDFTLGN